MLHKQKSAAPTDCRHLKKPNALKLPLVPYDMSLYLAQSTLMARTSPTLALKYVTCWFDLCHRFYTFTAFAFHNCTAWTCIAGVLSSVHRAPLAWQLLCNQKNDNCAKMNFAPVSLPMGGDWTVLQWDWSSHSTLTSQNDETKWGIAGQQDVGTW